MVYDYLFIVNIIFNASNILMYITLSKINVQMFWYYFYLNDRSGQIYGAENAVVLSDHVFLCAFSERYCSMCLRRLDGQPSA